jgi:hypothetical protein
MTHKCTMTKRIYLVTICSGCWSVSEVDWTLTEDAFPNLKSNGLPPWMSETLKVIIIHKKGVQWIASERSNCHTFSRNSSSLLLSSRTSYSCLSLTSKTYLVQNGEQKINPDKEIKHKRARQYHLSAVWALSIAARRGEVFKPTPTPPSTTPPMESTSAFTRRPEPELHPCIPTLISTILSLPSIQYSTSLWKQKSKKLMRMKKLLNNQSKMWTHQQ